MLSRGKESQIQNSGEGKNPWGKGRDGPCVFPEDICPAIEAGRGRGGVLTGHGQETNPELGGRSDLIVVLQSVRTKEQIQRLEAYPESCSVNIELQSRSLIPNPHSVQYTQLACSHDILDWMPCSPVLKKDEIVPGWCEALVSREGLKPAQD